MRPMIPEPLTLATVIFSLSKASTQTWMSIARRRIRGTNVRVAGDRRSKLLPPPPEEPHTTRGREATPQRSRLTG